MWVVLKYKPKEFEILKDSFFKILGEMPEFYNPKYKYELYINNKLKTFEKNILNSIHLDLRVSINFIDELCIKIMKVFKGGSSIILSNALTECRFKYSALSININFIFF